jgi:hypothetical protein
MQKVSSFGIILPHLSYTQLAYYTIKQVNQLVTNNVLYDATIFYEQLAMPCTKPACSVMDINEIWSFNGVLISTTIDNTIISSKAVNAAKKFFYVWDLEWLRNKTDYIYNIQAYRANNIQLIARSIDHAKAIENYCNQRVSIVLPHFNLDTLSQVINKV